MYSQNNEDDFLLEFFSDKKGVVLEIGAYDSKTFSNSKALIEKEWIAYLVDASPFCMTKLFEEYKSNNNVHIIQSLIDNHKTGLIAFHECPYSAVSSIDKDRLKIFQPNIDTENNYKEIFMTTITFSTLLSFVLYREETIDFLSIDIEGGSADLALSLDLNLIKPKCICIEHDSKQDQIKEYFKSYYDVVKTNGENIILTLK